MLPPRWRELAPEDGWQPGSTSPGGSPSGDSEGEDGGAAAVAAGAAGSGDEQEQQQEWADGVEADGGAAGEEQEGSGFGEARMASLLFYGVRGQQQREGDAPSFFNALEVGVGASCCAGGLGFLLQVSGAVPADAPGATVSCSCPALLPSPAAQPCCRPCSPSCRPAPWLS